MIVSPLTKNVNRSDAKIIAATYLSKNSFTSYINILYTIETKSKTNAKMQHIS